MKNTIFGGTTATPIPFSVTDQTYNPESENAQSGKAVDEALTNYVKNTDYATNSKGGVVKVAPSLGITCGYVSLGTLNIMSATNEEIDAKKQLYKPIVPANLEYAVNSVLKKEYELINTITVAPDTDGSLPKEVIFSADSEGNSFDLDNFFINMYGKLVGSGNISIGHYPFNTRGYLLHNVSLGFSADDFKKAVFAFRTELDGSVNLTLSGVVSKAISGYYSAQINGVRNVMVTPNDKKNSNFASVHKVSVYVSGTDTTWAEGCKFELWGIRK